MTHVYVIFSLNKRRFWFGRRPELAHVALTKREAQDWLAKALSVRREIEGKSWLSVDDRFRWCTSSAGHEYGRGFTYWPANADDLYHVEGSEYY